MPTYMTLQAIEKKLPYVDDPDVLRKAKSDPLLRRALEMSRPANWWGTGLGPQDVLPIAEQGIPITWVPSPVVLKALAAASVDDRINLLLSYEGEIMNQCRTILAGCRSESSDDVKPLLLRAFEAFEAGHHEAAIALGVAVTEGLALWASRLRAGVLASLDGGTFEKITKKSETMHNSLTEGYGLAGKELKSGILNQGLDVPRKALIAPIPKFFKPFYPAKGDLMPDTLSRHAVTHQPTVAHFSRENAIMAMMLGTSLLKEREEDRAYV